VIQEISCALPDNSRKEKKKKLGKFMKEKKIERKSKKKILQKLLRNPDLGDGNHVENHFLIIF